MPSPQSANPLSQAFHLSDSTHTPSITIVHPSIVPRKKCSPRERVRGCGWNVGDLQMGVKAFAFNALFPLSPSIFLKIQVCVSVRYRKRAPTVGLTRPVAGGQACSVCHISRRGAVWCGPGQFTSHADADADQECRSSPSPLERVCAGPR
jgi:hypothetical protein